MTKVVVKHTREVREAAETLLGSPTAVDSMAGELMPHRTAEEDYGDYFPYADEKVKNHWRAMVRRVIGVLTDREVREDGLSADDAERDGE